MEVFNLKIGSVIINKDNKRFVVTEVNNGKIIEKEKLEDFISDIVVIKYGDDYKTIREILEECCDKYLKHNEIIDEIE